MRCLSFRGFQGVRFQETRVREKYFYYISIIIIIIIIILRDLSMASLDVMSNNNYGYDSVSLR